MATVVSACTAVPRTRPVSAQTPEAMSAATTEAESTLTPESQALSLILSPFTVEAKPGFTSEAMTLAPITW